MLRKLAQLAIAAVTALHLTSIVGISSAAAAPVPSPSAGTLTQLPDGRYLITGDELNQTVSDRLAIYNPKTQQSVALSAKLSSPRKHHSATLLPDGRVFIYGGVGADNITLGSAELLAPASAELTTVAAPGLVARSRHSATLLTNGKLLILGGLSNGGHSLDQAELWDPRTGLATAVARSSALERSDAVARLLPDGNVLYQGGLDRNGKALTSSLLYNASSERFEEISLTESASLTQAADTQKSLVVTTTIPPAEASDFLPGGLITLRFSQPIDVTSATTQSVVLIGPTGAVAAQVVPSQDGMLVFLTPKIELFPATRYTLIVKGIRGRAGQVLGFDALGFSTASLTPGASSDGNLTPGSFAAGSNSASQTSRTPKPAASPLVSASESADDEIFLPGPQHQGGRWRLGREMPRDMTKRHNAALAQKGDLAYEEEGKKRRKALLRAAAVAATGTLNATASGTSGVAGQVMRINDQALANVAVSVAGQTTQTDAQGRFQIDNLAPGHHELFVDGTRAGSGGRQYAKFVIGIDIEAGQRTEMPTIFLPRIRAEDWIPIASPLNQDQVIAHPNIPGMEIHIPKGAVLRERDGRLVTRIALVPIPLDRMAFPFPENAPVFVSVQPGGLVVQGLTPGVTKGIRVIYPNASNEPLGGGADFWRYDAGGKGWYVYGKGQVSADGKQIVPNPGVAVYESIGFMYTPPPNSPPPPPDSPDCPSCECQGGDPAAGDPVSCASGLFLHYRTDLALPDIIPLTLSSSYRPGDSVNRPFGIGSSHPYAISLYFPSTSTYASAQLVLPDGRAIDFARISAGTGVADAVFESNSEPSGYFKSRITFNSANNRWILKTKEGSSHEFSNTAGVPLVAMSDRYGNTLNITRNGGLIQRITTPSGRYIDFTYDTANRISKLQDHGDRIVSYVYNVAGYLERVTYPDLSFEQYTYDTAGRMLTVQDRRGNIMVTNVYDANGRVSQQTLAGGGIYRFTYTLDTAGKITRTDVTEPRGNIKRYDFTGGMLTSQTFGLGTPEAQTTAYERQVTTKLVSATIDPLGRRTETTYDANGNPTRITRLAGTPFAVSDNFTYEPVFNQVTSYTNPLGKTRSFAYDTLGNLIRVTDPLGNQTKLAYNPAGQLLSVTDPLNNVVQFSYDLGDLITVTDPLGRVNKQFIDTLGRLTVATDALGNRTNYAYDALDRITQITDALGKLTQFSYDPLGNLLKLTDANGGATQYSYDTKNRLLTRTDPLLKNETYQYDGNDNTVKYTDRKAQITNQTYDALDRPITTTFADGSSVVHTYDKGNRLTQVIDSQSGTISRSYDGLNRLISETTPQGSVSYSYDAASRRTGMTVAGQAAIVYTYDNADRLTQITQGTANVSFAYDSANRRTSLTLPNGMIATYGYDKAAQLTAITYKLGATVVGDLAYTYDALGQRTHITGSLARTNLPSAVTTATHDLANRVTNWNGTTITYDLNGNMLNDGSRTYTWDARNRLVAIGGAIPASFKYDPFGRRISKTIAGVTTNYLYDGLNPVQELSGTTPSANLLTGLNIDERFRRSDSLGARDFLVDALGSTLALADSLGAIQTSYTYEPYGNTTVTGQANSNPYQYTGRERDGTGLYFYRARYYDPVRQRFISEDPIGLRGGLNLQAYVDGNPIKWTDPFGLFPGAGSPGGSAGGYCEIGAGGGFNKWKAIGELLWELGKVITGAEDPSDPQHQQDSYQEERERQKEKQSEKDKQTPEKGKDQGADSKGKPKMPSLPGRKGK